MTTAQQFGDLARWRIAHLWFYQVNSPDGVARVLQSNHQNYSKEVPGFDALKLVLGNGLVTSEGNYWRRQRRSMQPLFHHKHLRTYSDIMSTAASDMLGAWDKCEHEGQVVDVSAQMAHLTFRIVCEALFNTEIRDEMEAITTASQVSLEYLSMRFSLPLYPPPWVPTRTNRTFLKALAVLNRIAYGGIVKRREGAQTHDLLSVLMTVQDRETAAGMDDKQLRDEIITFAAAGSGTTARALTWALYLLACHPEAGRRLRAEVTDVLDGRPPSAMDLPNLPFTRCVIEEAMRLYPPTWVTARRALAEDEIAGYHIPAGAIMVISPYVLHRMPPYWPNPEEFDPDRFARDEAQKRPRFAYLPFGGGPHICIGKDFALMESMIVLTMIAQRYRLDLVAGHRVVPYALGAGLHPRNGLPMTLHQF